MSAARRVLAIVGVFPPFGGPGAIRLVKLFKQLPAHGWQVEVIAPAGRAGWYRDPALARELGDTIVHRVGRASRLGDLATSLRTAAKDGPASDWRLRLLRRAMGPARLVRDLVSLPDEYLLWAVAAWRRARVLVRERRFDALFTSSFPYSCHLAGLGLGWRARPPWLVELRDPWLGNVFRQQGRAWRRPIDGWLERQVVSGARGIVVATPGTAQILEAHHGESVRSKLSVITNGYDPADFRSPRASGRDGRLELLYVGTFEHPLQPPDTFLDALDLVLAEEPAAASRLVLRILGGVDLESGAQIRAWRAKHPGVDAVVLEPFCTHPEATAAMLSADALVVSVAANSPWVLTSKVFEYLGSGRPILAVVPEGDCRALLERCGGAALFRPGEARPLADGLLRMLGSGELTLARPRDAAVVAEYAHPALAAQLARRLDEVARG